MGGGGRDMMGATESHQQSRGEGALSWDSVGAAVVTLSWAVDVEPLLCEGCSYMNIPGMSVSDPWLCCQNYLKTASLITARQKRQEKSPYTFQMCICRSTISCAKIPSHCPESHLSLTSLEIIIG